jgi:general secretion pathway protein B
MSYILDALKRAEAERERGSVPGLHARQLASYDDLDAPTSPTWLWWITAGALALLAGGAGFWWWHTPVQNTSPSIGTTQANAKAAAPDASVAAVGAPMVQAPTNPAPTDAVNPPKLISKTLPTPAPVVAVVVAPQPAAKAVTATASPSVPAPAPVTAAAVAPTPLSPAKPVPQTMTPPHPVAMSNPAKVAASPTGSGVPLLSELPEALRRQIPPLVIAGAVYSDDPSQRLLIVNNQAIGQGSTAAPGVQLEEIQTSSSIFSFQGIRFQLNH